MERKNVYVAIDDMGIIRAYDDNVATLARHAPREEYRFHYIEVEAVSLELLGKSLSDVSPLHRELRELREVVEMLKQCTVMNDPPKPNDILYYHGNEDKDPEKAEWCIQGFTDEYHPSLHSALKSLLGEAKG